MTIDDGGSAFPRTAEFHPNERYCSSSQDGMSLRDWFAGRAMHALLIAPNGQEYENPDGTPVETFDEVAKSAYEMADEMLKAREL